MILNDANDKERLAIVSEARSWLGVPFRFRGTSRNGVDCVTFLMLVGKHTLGWNVPNPAYVRATEERAWAWIRHHARRLAPGDAGPGDIVQFVYNDQAVHFGVLTSKGFIHAAVVGRKMVREDRMSEQMLARVVAYYRARKGMELWRNSR